MEYPIWQLTTLGGGFWIALIATVHVYVAHFAVGGGLFLVITEQATYRTGNIDLLNYTKKHTRFFLLLTMAFGAVSGVAIWFTIALLAPQATITLIHQFVFGWAAEWVCFLGEIVALIIYYYTWETMDRHDHVIVGWLYFLFGWFSLFLINGIVGFMLTPGDWIQTKDFWDGFFNPTFWPQLVFRTFFSAACAGLFGFVTATRIEHQPTRLNMVRTCSALTILGVLATIASGWWYVAALPDPQFQMLSHGSHRAIGFLQWFWLFGILTLLGGLVLAFKMPRTISFSLALIVLLAGQGLFGSFEFLREAARKPYLIWDYTYSNSIQKALMPVINQQGALASAKWTPPPLRDGITDANRMAAGEFLFQLQCASCHSIGGPMNDIKKRTTMYDTDGMAAFLTGMGKLSGYMPPFAGKDDEKRALAVYIAEGLNGKAATPVTIPEPVAAAPAPFDAESAEYALVAWADRGMRFFAQSDKWTLLPPGSVIKAQLVLRDALPERVSKDVTLTFAVEPGFKGDTLTGTLAWKEDTGRFEASLAPIPYQEGKFSPLPMVTLTAKDSTGKVLATTRLAAPVSDQMGCLSCHGGDWARDGSGVADATVGNLLAIHDRMNRTDLASRDSVACADCHADPAQNAAGQEGHALPFPQPSTGCMRSSWPDAMPTAPVSSATRRTPCADGMPRRIWPAPIVTVQWKTLPLPCSRARATPPSRPGPCPCSSRAPSPTRTAVNPRKPWTMQPDCLTCHAEFTPPSTDDAFNQWTKDATGLYSMHAATTWIPWAAEPVTAARTQSIRPETTGTTRCPCNTWARLKPWARLVRALSAMWTRWTLLPTIRAWGWNSLVNSMK